MRWRTASTAQFKLKIVYDKEHPYQSIATVYYYEDVELTDENTSAKMSKW